MQSSAAKKAAQVQTQAAQNQQGYIQQGMAQLGQLYAPYTNLGAQSANTLGRLLTPGGGAAYASRGPTATTPGMGMPTNPGIGMQQYGTQAPPMQQPQPMPQPYPQQPYPQGAPPQYYGGTFAQFQPPPPSQMQFGGPGGYYPQPR
jgi:hypothetical protein